MICSVLYYICCTKNIYGGHHVTFTPCGELCFTVLEENIASIFRISELVQVAAKVVRLQKIVGFSTPSLHHPPGPIQSPEDSHL